MAESFVNLDGHHVNVSSIVHVAEVGDDVDVTFHGGTVTKYTGENAAAIKKAVGAKATKAHKDDDDDKDEKAKPHPHAAHHAAKH